MIRVKVTTEHPHWPFLQQTPEFSGIWGDCQFYVDEPITDCDYWMVIDGLRAPETVQCPPANVILFTGEPPSVRRYVQGFLNQFATVVSCQREIRHHHLIYSPPPLPWHTGVSYDDMASLSIHKDRTLSLITSNKRLTTGHRRRYDAALKLKSHFGSLLDIYGRGIREFERKWDVQAPYRYSIVMENTVYADYFTEKLADCLLTETFPFYYGCPNIDDYFPPGCLLKIDVEDIDQTIAQVAEITSNPDHYEQHLQQLRAARQHYLDNFSFFAIMDRFAAQPGGARASVTLLPEKRNQWKRRLKAPLVRMARQFSIHRTSRG